MRLINKAFSVLDLFGNRARETSGVFIKRIWHVECQTHCDGNKITVHKKVFKIIQSHTLVGTKIRVSAGSCGTTVIPSGNLEVSSSSCFEWVYLAWPWAGKAENPQCLWSPQVLLVTLFHFLSRFITGWRVWVLGLARKSRGRMCGH